MNKLAKDQAGIAHLVLIIVFVVALVGISGFAYMRISDQNQTASQSQEADDESDIVDADEDADQDLTPEESADAEAGADEPGDEQS
jgi:flagellar basal body-associated protein FliL